MQITQYHPRAASGDGGITNSVRRLSAAFVRAGARAIIVCDTDAAPPSDDDGVEWRPVAHRRVGRILIPTGLGEAFAGSEVVVLNSAWTSHNALAGRVARRNGIPYVMAPRGAYDPLILRRRRLLKRAWWHTVERELTTRAAAVHIFFESQASHLRSLGYAGALIVAPNGVVPPTGHRWIGPAGEYLLYLGRFDPEHKGLDLLVRAVAGLPSGQLPPLRLHGPDWGGGKERLARLVRDLTVEDRVQVGDAVHGDAKWDLIARARGFVYPSRWEGFGNSVAEAAVLGVPTLVTPYPLGTFLAERDAAVLAPATIDGLRDGLLRLVGDEAEAIGDRARLLVRDHFSWDEVARTWIDQLSGAGIGAGAPNGGSAPVD